MYTLSPDAEVLILCWAQLQHALLLTSEPSTYLAAQQDTVQRLKQDYNIQKLQLLARTLDEYTISFTKDEVQQLVSFPADEIDDFI